jgi:hypothetical protein
MTEGTQRAADVLSSLLELEVRIETITTSLNHFAGVKMMPW